MSELTEELRDKYGTLVFDARQARRGYALNMCCIALCRPEAREAFKADPAAFVQRFPMSQEQRQAFVERNYNRLLELGGNIYYLSKVAAMDGKSFQQLASIMTGIPEDEFKALMVAGGRPYDTLLRVHHDEGACRG